MTKSNLPCILITLFIASTISSYEVTLHEERKVYIVYIGSIPEGKYLVRSHHINLLQNLGHINRIAEKLLVRSYSKSFNGFAANLTLKEASKMKSMEGIVLIFESKKLQILTTRSWDYMRFSLDVPRNPTIESDIIIGHFDTGVKSNADSLSDHNLGDVPKHWKGVCNGGKNFTCNKKLIGARYYGGESAIDDAVDSHGTMTASMAVGRVVENANFYGIANGTARGGVPSARIAVYKVCGSECKDEDILAAFDDAIADNVDIITASFGNISPGIISEDTFAIGSFHAMKNGILTIQAGGNTFNNIFKTVTSIAPWLFSVGASNIDRKIINQLILGNGRTIESIAVSPFSTGPQSKKLVYGEGVRTCDCNYSIAMQCKDGCIDPSLVKGNIIICDMDQFTPNTSSIINEASGIIMRRSNGRNDTADTHLLPTASLTELDFHYIESYFKSVSFPTARILKSETIHDDAHVLSSFSGRGPNTIIPEILKPDIVAPGLNIMAESPRYNGVSFGVPYAKYNINSGTSVACPQVTGIIAYVKSKNPDWSISAIKSSLMTTARTMDIKHNTNAEFGYGAGHIDPMKAIDPGLVYETFEEEYINMFCSLGLEGNKLREIFGVKGTCSKEIIKTAKDLNYPTMTSPVHPQSSFKIEFPRTVTNVGNANSIYHAHLSTEDNTIKINVEPIVLSFDSVKEKKFFVVTVSGHWLNQDHISGSLVWFDGIHSVKSPILLYRSTIL